LNQPSQVQNGVQVDPDVQLMLRVKDDDAAAFEMLVDRHQVRITRFMRGWVSRAEIAEELAQEVFLRVYRARKTYMPTAKFTTWLYRIAHNIASNHVRDSAHRREIQLTSYTNPESDAISLERMAIAPSGFQPHRQLDHEERSAMILQAVQALGDRQRTAIMLSKFESMSYQEIADLMDMSVQAVKSLLSRARVNLKQMLEPYIESGQPLLPTLHEHTEDEAAQ
jgi:RNA polymerase sigma-70 factor, ECF subfamily